MKPKGNDKITAGVEVESAEKKESIGQILQAARLSQGINLKDISRQLRLSETQVIAIEEDDFSKFQSHTYLRGFIRNYAKLVREDSKKFTQLLQENLPLNSPQAISYQMDGTPFRSKHKQSKGNIIIILTVILVTFLLAYEVYRSGGNETQVDENINDGAMTEAPIQIENLVKQGLKDSQDQSSSVVNSNVKQRLKDDHEQLSPVKNANEPNFSTINEEAKMGKQSGNYLYEGEKIEEKSKMENKYALHFRFTGESWVEVKDVKGNTILSRINPSNTEKIVYGTPPFSLIIGNAVDVKLVYNDKPVDLVPYTNRGVARLSLD